MLCSCVNIHEDVTYAFSFIFLITSSVKRSRCKEGTRSHIPCVSKPEYMITNRVKYLTLDRSHFIVWEEMFWLKCLSFCCCLLVIDTIKQIQLHRITRMQYLCRQFWYDCVNNKQVATRRETFSDASNFDQLRSIGGW